MPRWFELKDHLQWSVNGRTTLCPLLLIFRANVDNLCVFGIDILHSGYGSFLNYSVLLCQHWY